MKQEQLIQNIRDYLNIQLNNLSKNSPLISIMQPLLTRAIDNKLPELKNYLGFITNSDGEIDINNILSEMIANIVNTNSFTVDLPIIGPTIIGEGKVQFNLPYINKCLVLHQQDLQELKNILTSNT